MMKISDLIKAYAEDLENPDNEAIMLSEDDDISLAIVTEAFVKAASILKSAAEDLALIEPESSVLTPERLEEIAAVAESFDESGDEFLMKQAGLIDEILLTIGAPKGVREKLSKAENERIEELKKKYRGSGNLDRAADAVKDIKKSEYYKQYRPLAASMNTRYCPDHAGTSISRVSSAEWQCELDKKIYNFESGYTLMNGDVVPGVEVAKQSPMNNPDMHQMFDTRESRLGNNYIK